MAYTSIGRDQHERAAIPAPGTIMGDLLSQDHREEPMAALDFLACKG
jgi:hypothetical protein